MSPAAPSQRWSWLLVASLAGWLVLLGFRPVIAAFLGLGMNDGWFIDLHAILAAGEADLLGLPIHLRNPLDLLQRPHSYSNWWLAVGPLGLKRGDEFWLGPLLVAAFVAVAAFTLRPANRRQFAWSLLFLGAPAVQLCLVRANNDLVVFLVLALLVPALVNRLAVARFGAATLIALATGLKYYPAVTALLLFAEPSRRLQLWRGVFLAALGVLVLLSVYEDTLYFSRTLPQPERLFSFGAAHWLSWLGGGPAGARLLAGVGLLGLLGLAARFPLVPTRAPGARRTAELWFALGAVLLAGCFWAGANWAYRWIFAAWLLPLLWAEPPPGRARPATHRLLRLLLPICLWWDGLASLAWNFGWAEGLGLTLERYSQTLWLAIQPMHWLVFGTLTVLCGQFALGWLRQTWLTGPDPAPAPSLLT